MDLHLFGKTPGSVFALNGYDENSVTYALGWTLSKSPCFLQVLGKDLLGKQMKINDTHIYLQRSLKNGGVTDIELLSPTEHVIFEAKRHIEFPRMKQLSKYADRFDRQHLTTRLLVSLSAASQECFKSKMPNEVSGVRLVHRSWSDICCLLRKATTTTKKHAEKRWLRELKTHLKEYVVMRNIYDNRVLVVALSKKPINGEKSQYTWIDAVVKDNSYFHPIKGKYPKCPPNYIGFRYDGRLQSIHYIESHETVDDTSLKNSNWPDTKGDGECYFVYKLGPAILPRKEIRSGNIRNSKCCCAIDTLLSGKNKQIKDALEETNKRKE